MRFSYIVLIKTNNFQIFSWFGPQMAMRIEFAAQIMKQVWICGRVSFHALNIRCANKLTRYKYKGLVWSASFFAKLIAYSFCKRERKRNYVFQWQTAHSKWKWTSIAMVPDLCLTTVNIFTHLISRYQLPLRYLKHVRKFVSWPGHIPQKIAGCAKKLHISEDPTHSPYPK